MRYDIKVYRQNRKNLMMRARPGGLDVFIPHYLRKNSPEVHAFIEAGREKLGALVPPVPVERSSPAAIRAMVTRWAKRIGVQPTRVQFRTMYNKWGSCSSRSTITLNRALCWAPPHLAEYVVCHELVHLHIFNHGAAFRTMMSSYMPDWEDRERELAKLTFGA
jgi:predicted metal-dependent hydrolase